jgi:mannose-1-phosphate guanylyltransferase
MNDGRRSADGSAGVDAAGVDPTPIPGPEGADASATDVDAGADADDEDPLDGRTVVALVLAGGVGSRLYPASRSDRPKQFLSLPGAEPSLLSRTVERASFADETLIVTRPAFVDRVREHAPEAAVLAEPRGRNTGPAVTYGTHVARVRFGGPREPVVVVLPSDHYVPDADAFRETTTRGARVAARTGRLVAFGVEPTRPEPGYGYVEPGADRGDHRDLVAFHEKPAPDVAADYLAAGYLWNAGLFAWTPPSFLAAASASPLAPLVDALSRGDPDAGFAAVDPVSVDRAVMERTDHAAVVPVDFAWDDLGTWDALRRVLATEGDAGDAADGDDAAANGTAVVGDATTIDATDCVVATDGDTHAAVVGVDGLVVAAYDGRVLVAPADEGGRVREVVDRLRAADRF